MKRERTNKQTPPDAGCRTPVPFEVTAFDSTTDQIEWYHTLNPGDYTSLKFIGACAVQERARNIRNLQIAGLDLGGGSRQYGFKAPVPPNGSLEAELTIWKRY